MLTEIGVWNKCISWGRDLKREWFVGFTGDLGRDKGIEQLVFNCSDKDTFGRTERVEKVCMQPLRFSHRCGL